ncbi:MAG: hypothetical protein AAFQ94_29420 [Bacteroidota bacterium]
MEMTTFQSIIIGVASGVLASLMLIACSQFFYKIFLPWYESITYKGIDISGEWSYDVDYVSGNKSNFFAKINQKAENISCTISETKTLKNNKTEARIFEYKGKIVDRFLTLTGRNSSKKNLGVYVFLLEVKGDGGRLEGYCSRYCLTDCIIKSDPVNWERK